MILDLMDRGDLEPTILNEASAEIREQYLDCSKAKQLLGWEPRFALKDGLGETISWYERWLAGG